MYREKAKVGSASTLSEMPDEEWIALVPDKRRPLQILKSINGIF